jgi:hypothetical protein
VPAVQVRGGERCTEHGVQRAEPKDELGRTYGRA